MAFADIGTQDLSYSQSPSLPLGFKSLGERHLHPTILFLNQIILEQGLDNALAGFLEESRIEVDGFTAIIEKTKRRTFDGEAVCNVEVSPDGDPGTIFFIFFNLELTTEEPKHLSALTYQFW